MSAILNPGSGVLFMKVGVHANESLEAIIARKSKEIEDAGYAMWGYGGNTCHPRTMVQPFAKDFEQRGQLIRLCMQEMASKHFAQPVRADQYSVDGSSWLDIHPGVNVLGSRYALVIKNLRKEEFVLPLANTTVAAGNCLGRSGDKYVSGRVDKACLVVESLEGSLGFTEGGVQVGLVADLIPPHAVFLRNLPS